MKKAVLYILCICIVIYSSAFFILADPVDTPDTESSETTVEEILSSESKEDKITEEEDQKDVEPVPSPTEMPDENLDKKPDDAPSITPTKVPEVTESPELVGNSDKLETEGPEPEPSVTSAPTPEPTPVPVIAEDPAVSPTATPVAKSTEDPTATPTDEPKAVPKKAPALRGVNSTLLTYENGKYVYDGVEHNDFPASGDFVLGSDIPVSKQINVAGNLNIDFGGYEIIDSYTGTNWLFSVQQNDNLTFEGTGTLRYSSTARHTAVYVNNGGHFTMTDDTSIEDYASNGNGAAVNVQHANDVFTMSGNAVIRNCSSSSSSGGGGVNIYRGTFYMTDNATVTECHTTSNGGEKSGNGAGIQVGNNGKMYLSGNAQIINNSGTGYHGAGIDLWSSGVLYLSGSPTITGNMNGRNEPVNLYAGSVVNINGPMTGTPGSIGISVQSNPVFTSGLTAQNPGVDIDDLITIFDADRYHWQSLARHEEYSVIDYEETEAMQSPTITVHFMYNRTDTTHEFKSQMVVPGGYAVSPGTPTWTGYNFKGWFRNSAGTGSAWSFGSNMVPVNDDLYLYAKWELKTYTVTITGDNIGQAGSATVQHGSDYNLTVTSDPKYQIVSVKVDNREILPAASVQPVTSFPVSITNVTGNHTIQVVTEQYQADVTLTVTENGNESHFHNTTPDAQVTIPIGTDFDFSYLIDEGYYVSDMLVNGVSVGTFDGTCGVSNVTEDTVIEVTVSKQFYVDIVYEGYIEGVLIQEPSCYVIEGEDFSFNVSTDTGYIIEEIQVNGSAITITNNTSQTVTLTGITEDMNVKVKITTEETFANPMGYEDEFTIPALILCLMVAVMPGTMLFKRRKRK